MDSDEKGVFLLSLTTITEERMVEIFLHPDQKPEGNTAKPTHVITSIKHSPV